MSYENFWSLQQYIQKLQYELQYMEDPQDSNTDDTTAEDFPVEPEVQGASRRELTSPQAESKQNENGKIKPNKFTSVETKTKQAAKQECVEEGTTPFNHSELITSSSNQLLTSKKKSHSQVRIDYHIHLSFPMHSSACK